MLVLRLIPLLAAVSAATLSACSATVEQRGNLPPPDEIAQIHPGKTTKDQVVKILGTPSSVSVFNDKDWYYISLRTKQFAFLDPKVLDQEVYVVDFNDDGIVRAVGHKTLADSRDVVPVARVTPAPGRELTFLEQVLGNLGRFNGGGGGTGGGGTGGGGGGNNGPSPHDETH
jgi:outer membrane protein assembly factor BamE (lipoprotein component of BamABCDE complex)